MAEDISVSQLLEFMAMPELAAHFQSEYHEISVSHHVVCYCYDSRSARFGLMVEHLELSRFSVSFTFIYCSLANCAMDKVKFGLVYMCGRPVIFIKCFRWNF